MKKRRILLNAVALVTLGSGVLNLLSVIGPSLPERGALLRQLYPLEYLRVSRFPAHDSQDEWKGWMLEGRMVLELWELNGKAFECFSDGIWLAGGIGVATLVVPLPRNLLGAGDILGVATLLATGVVIYLVFRKRQTLMETKPGGSTGWKPRRWVYSILGHLSCGMGIPPFPHLRIRS